MADRTHKYINEKLDSALMDNPFTFSRLGDLVQRYVSMKHRPGLAFQRSEDLALADLQRDLPEVLKLLNDLQKEIS